MGDSKIDFDYFPGEKKDGKSPGNSQKEEKRTYIRKPFFMSVDYSTQDRVYRDFIKDISTGGVFIETLRPLPVGQEISMAFSFPNLRQNFKISGDVVRMDPKGIGVAFMASNEKQKETLDFCVKDI
ncbi:MAG: PilZ domain-containing protein [Deltaproteobacteria bacterium]|nr:PilZ domain-containing protein [Deltaproteobacteria bacterium]